MKSRKFESKLFTDPYIESLTLEEKFVYIYYLFNSKVNWLGCYEISDRQVLFEVGDWLSTSSLQIIKDKFNIDNKIKFYKHYVIIRNSEHYDNHMNNIQLMRSALKQFLELEEETQKAMLQFKPRHVIKEYQDMFSRLGCSLLVTYGVDEIQIQIQIQIQGHIEGENITEGQLDKIAKEIS
jgi:hypothetical protein